MSVIKKSTLRAFWERKGNAAAQRPLLEWFKVCRVARWSSFADVRQTRGDADVARVQSGRTATIFDIGGNKWRIITLIDYARQRMLVTHVMDLKEHDRNTWKKQL
jgi:mRNA interferase HigB